LHCLLELYSVYVFSWTVLFVSISQVIGCKKCLQNDLDLSGAVLNSAPTPTVWFGLRSSTKLNCAHFAVIPKLIRIHTLAIYPFLFPRHKIQATLLHTLYIGSGGIFYTYLFVHQVHKVSSRHRLDNLLRELGLGLEIGVLLSPVHSFGTV